VTYQSKKKNGHPPNRPFVEELVDPKGKAPVKPLECGDLSPLLTGLMGKSGARAPHSKQGCALRKATSNLRLGNVVRRCGISY